MSIESTKISLNNEVQGEFNFQLEYNQIPTVQLSAETSSDDQGMVNVFITQLTTKFVKFETSAPFTGQIHIHR